MKQDQTKLIKVINQAIHAINTDCFVLVGGGYIKHGNLRTVASMILPDYNQPYTISFELRIPTPSDLIVSVSGYLELVHKQIQRALKRQLFLFYIYNEERCELTELAEHFPELVNEFKDEIITNGNES